MAQMLFFTRKLHSFAGRKLYLNLLSMIAISLFDGVGIYLLVPMLGLIGVFNLNIGSALPISWITDLLGGIPDDSKLLVILAVYLVLVMGQALLQRYQTVLNSTIQQGFITALRMETYQAILNANWEFFLRKRKSDFHHVMTSELARVSQGTNLFLQLITSVSFTAIQIGLAFWLSAKLTALVLVSGIALSLFSRRYVKKAKRLGDQTTSLSQHYFAGITEHFNGIKDIKSNRLEDSHIRWFESLNERIKTNAVQFVQMNSATQFFYKAAAALLIAFFVYISLDVFKMPAELPLLVILIFSRLWPRFSLIQSSVEYIVSMLPAFKSLMDLQQESNSAGELPRANPADSEMLSVKRRIECRDVYYRYGSGEAAYALRNINLTIPSNRMTAIVGKSGAGKSTLIDLIMGLIQPERGEITVDGAHLTADRVQRLRKSISYVSQDPFLFHASIRENMMIVEPEASEEQIWEALKFSASDTFVRELPQGLDTVIGDRGVRLSGGERQRIVLARAILRKPSILVLDEATSALDTENEAKIQQALDRLKGTMTLIVIAHRMSTIRNADQVIVLEHGEIVQQGAFQQLSKETRGTFSKLLGYQAGLQA